MNKNVSVWRGTTNPPTNYHVWVNPSDLTIKINIDGLWVPLTDPNIKNDLENYVNGKIDELKKGADVDLDTLEEISKWIKEHQEDYTIQLPKLEAAVDSVKSSIDIIEKGNKPLVSPVINGVWKYYNQSNEEVSLEGVIEYGYKAQFTGTYTWTSTEGYKDPTTIKNTSNWSDLPLSGEASNVFTSPIVTNNTTIQVTIQAPKTGLMVSGEDVVFASGMDELTDTTSVNFNYRRYFGVTNVDPTEDIIKSLNSELGSKASTKSATTTNSQYYVYAYPSSLGDLSKITQDGATPVLGAFTKKTISITNTAGLLVDLNVYISNNPGAFNNNSLKFE